VIQRLDGSTTVIFQNGAKLDIVNDLRLSNGGFFGGEGGTSWPVVRVGGTRVGFGRAGQVYAHLIAPLAKIRVAVGGFFNGTMCGRDIKGAVSAQWSCDDSVP
jgi:hypothetical protein